MDSRLSYSIYLCTLVALLFFFGLGARDFWAPVEPRYAEIARVMFTKGEWIVPTVNGDLYTDKPILYFWLVLLSAKIIGAVNEWTVRVPAAIGGVGLVLTTYLFGRDFFTPRIGVISAAVLATCLRVIWEARWAHVDTLFCWFFVLSVYFGARALLRKGALNEILLAYGFMALATLVKGLIGVVLPALLFIAFVVVRRDGRMIVDAKLPVGISLFLLVAAPWFYLVNEATQGKWLNDFILVHHIQRYTAGAGHRQPFYYYFTTLPVDFLPWTAFAIPSLFAYWPFRPVRNDPTVQFVFLWFLVVFLFFSVSDTKRDLYLLPLLPTLALLVGNYLDGLASRNLPQDVLYRWITIGYFFLVALMGLALPLTARIIRPDALGAILPASVVIAVGGMGVVQCIRGDRPLRAVTCLCAMMTLTTISASQWIFPYMERFKSPRSFSMEVKKIVSPTAALYIYADTMNDFNYYMARETIPILSSPESVDALLAGGKTSYMLVKERDFKRLPQLPQQKIVASDAKGSTTWYLVEIGNRAAIASAH